MRCVFKVEVLHLDGWKSAEPSSLSVRESQPYGQTLRTSIALEEERDGWQSTDVQALSDRQGKHYPAMTPTAIDVAGLDVAGHLGVMRVARPSNDNALPDKAGLCIGLQSPTLRRCPRWTESVWRETQKPQ
jgi:hypothetical protein